MWKKDDQNLSFLHPFPPHSSPGFSAASRTTPEPSGTPHRSTGMKQPLPPSPLLSSLDCSTDTTGGLAPESKLPDRADLSFFFEILLAGLYPNLIYGLLWPQIPAGIQNSLSSASLPSNQSPSSPQRVGGHGFVGGLGSQDSQERRPWFYIIVFPFFNALSSCVGKTGPGFSTGPARTLSEPQSFYE